MSGKALRLIKLGFHPVLLGRTGEGLKRPLHKGWRTATYVPEAVAAWPARNNVGIRCGRQRNGLALVVFDFDEEADRVFPAWRREATKHVLPRPVVVTSGRGYHVYTFTGDAYRGRTLAARYAEADGRRRLYKFIETLGRGRQVVCAGSRHPGGKRYRFLGDAGYTDIPTLDPEQYRALVSLSRRFDERPSRRSRSPARPVSFTGELADIRDCLDYARRFIGAEERVEGNGDIRFLGHGGLLVTADGRGWYSFSDETGGGLAELIAWHRALVGEG